MSARFRTGAIFVLAALGFCCCFLAYFRGARVAKRSVVEAVPAPRVARRSNKPKRVALAPPVADEVRPESIVDPETVRERSFYARPAARSDSKARDGVLEVFPSASSVSTTASPLFSVWAKFPVGSWSRARVAALTFEDGKKVESVTETQATLVAVDFERKRYSLRYDATIKMGGVDHQRPPEIVEYNFWDELADEEETEEDGEPTNLLIDGRVAPCLVKRLTRNSGNVRETTTIWFSPVLTPHVLQRETVRESLEDGKRKIAARELFVVQKTSEASLVAPTIEKAIFSKSFGGRAATGSSLRSSAFPGGVARETTIETDLEEKGEPYRSEKTLLDYYIAP